MNPKQVTILAILAAIAGGIYFVVNQKHDESINTKEVAKIGDPAVESFDVPSVTKISIAQKNRAVTLEKKADEWVVVERDGYSADGKKARGLLYMIKDMKVAESRSSRGQVALKELQLLSPQESGEGGSGAGTLVKISAGSQEREIIFGSNYASSGGRGRFIKNTDGQIYVVATNLQNLETDPAAWLEKEFFRVQDAEAITVEHEKSEDSFSAFRESKGAPVELEDPAEGEELSASISSSLGNVLSSASFVDYVVGDDAKPEKTGLDKAITATIKTFDNFTYVVKLGAKNDEGHIHLSYDVSAEIPEPSVEPEEDAATDEDEKELSDEEKAARDEEFAKKSEEKRVRGEERAKIKRLSEKLEKEKLLAGKVYLVYGFAVDSLMKKRSEILKTEEDKKKEAEAAAKKAANPNGSPNPALGGSPNIISQGPNGERRVTATTAPVALDPAAVQERMVQEQLAKEKYEADRVSAAIKDIIRESQEKKAKDTKAEKADEVGEASAEEATEATEEATGATDKATDSTEETTEE